MRVVSLLPSATEIVYAVGAEDQLCGVTFECDEPPQARARHRVLVTGADTSAMSPADIDAYVREKLARGEDLYSLAPGALADINPDVVLTQDLCRVCAVNTESVQDALDVLGCRADVLTLDPHSLEEERQFEEPEERRGRVRRWPPRARWRWCWRCSTGHSGRRRT